MRRYLLGTLLASVAFAGGASAQHHGGGGHAGGVHVGGGGVHMSGYHPAGGAYHAPSSNYRIVQAPPVYRSPGVGGIGIGIGSGLYGGYGLGGGYSLGGGYGLSRGYYGSGGLVGGGYSSNYGPSPGYGGGIAPPAYYYTDPSGATAVSGLLPATLVIQYPAPAKVWLDGVEVGGDPDTSWTFTSKDLRPGETATFKVRARWDADGKTYEAAREIPLGPGSRSRLVVVSGNEVTQ